MKAPTKVLLVSSVLLAAMGIASVTLAKPAASPPPTKLVQQLTDYLKSLQQFSYRAQVSYDEPATGGKKVTHSFTVKTSVHRPDRIRVSAAGDEVNKDFYLNGSSIVLYDKTAKVYAVMPVPSDIEGALAKAHKEYNLKVALTDLASPQLYQHLSKNLPGARNLGTEKVQGMPCYHLVFHRDNREMQLWINTGKKPLLRKLVISEKTPQGELTWTALLSDWNVAAKFDNSLFTFVAPAGVKKIRFLPVHQAAASGQAKQPAQGGK